MSKKLTIADYLTFEDWCKYPKAAGITSDGAKYNGLEDFYHNKYKVLAIPVSDCKLQLRSVEDLTEGEKKHIVTNFFHKVYNNYLAINWDFPLIINYCKFDLIINLIDYLRSININIDGFIESGKAVKQ